MGRDFSGLEIEQVPSISYEEAQRRDEARIKEERAQKWENFFDNAAKIGKSIFGM